ncbi:MAG: hypothetical protein V5A57_02155 [Candidatus Paceibacterota bacterium]
MIRFNFSLKDIFDAQSVIEDLYGEDKEIDYKQIRKIRAVYSDLNNKINLIETGKKVLEERSPNYSTDGIDYVKKIVTFRDRLNTQGVYLERLKKLREILKKLLDEKQVGNDELEEATAILDQLIDFRLES